MCFEAHLEVTDSEATWNEMERGQYGRKDPEEGNQEITEHRKDKACLFTTSKISNFEKLFQN